MAKFDMDEGSMARDKQRQFQQKGMSETGALKKSLSKSKGQAPKGMRLSALEIRPAATGVIMRHSFTREPGVTAGKSAPQQPDLTTMEPQEHAFGSTAEAMAHLHQHLGSLFGRTK